MSQPCAICLPIDCDFPNDLELYSLDGLPFFTADLYQFVTDCPPGFDCHIPMPPITIPSPPGPKPNPNPVTVSILCCNEPVVGVFPAGATLEQMREIANKMFAACAKLQLKCITNPPDPNPPYPKLNLKLGSLSKTKGCVDYSFQSYLTASSNNTPLGFSIVGGQLPPGLIIQSVSAMGAVITGTPTATGVYTFTVQACWRHLCKTKQYTISIIGISNTSPLPDAPAGVAYSVTLTPSAGLTPPLSYQVTAGVLPPGLTLDESTGVISGTPLTSGTYLFTVTLQDKST